MRSFQVFDSFILLLFYADSGLEHASVWLTKAQQNCAVSAAAAEQVTPLTILHQAYVDLVTQSSSNMPEV